MIYPLDTDLNAILLTGRGLWKTPKKIRGAIKRVSQRGFPQPMRHMRVALPRVASNRLRRDVRPGSAATIPDNKEK